jgi:surface-anchored protein
MHLARTRRASAALVALAALTAGVLVPVGAQAAEGAPPQSQTRQIISGVHTDAVSTFVDDGKLVLGTKADIGKLGTRFDPATSVINIEDAARMTIPDVPAYSFLGEPGTPLWLAPEVQQQGVVWPGFSTESVPVGTFEGNRVDVALTGFDGPGEVEVWDGSGAFGAPGRIFSSRDGSQLSNSYRFGVPQHKHVNWGFTAAGSYSLTFTATATIAGAVQTATQTYSFVVGDIAPAVATSVTLAASPAELVVGETATLDATLTPANAAGAVEFFDGTTSLGHAVVENGTASLEVPMGSLGERSLTASFVPSWTNDFTPATSTATTVTVTEEAGGDVFSIRGVAPSYAAGDRLKARVTGIALADDEVVRWVLAPTDDLESSTFLYGDDDQLLASPTIDRELSSSYNGYSLQALVTKRDKYKALQSTDFVPLVVTGSDTGSGIPIALNGLGDSYYTGDVVELTTDAQLAAGQSYHWVSRYAPVFTLWQDVAADQAPVGSNPFLAVPSNFYGTELALQIRDESGTVLGQSAPYTTETKTREVQFSGLQSVYRTGDTLTVTADIYPKVEGAAYSWSTVDADYNLVPIEGQTGSTLTIPVTKEMADATIYFSAAEPRIGANVAFESFTVKVTDSAPGEQVLYFNTLPGHFHQGNTVSLQLTSDPMPADSDSYQWSWKRPDQAEWVALKAATGSLYEVRAQQALDGAQVKADLVDADGEVLASAEPVTIHVDDHGAAPTEKAAIAGLADGYKPGAPIALTAAVTPDSVLSRWEWYVQKAGELTPVRVSDIDGPAFTATASDELDGAAIFARLTFDDGRRYIESAPVLIAIDGHNTEVPATELSITSDRAPDDYWAGQTATLTAQQTVPTGLIAYRWLVKAPGAAEFTAVDGKTTQTYSFKPNPKNSGTQVKVQLLREGAVHAESAPVTITAGLREPATTISVTADKTVYAPGDIAHFTSSQNPATGVDHFHWYLKRVGSADFVWVDQSRDSDLKLPLTAEDDGAQLVIRMFDETHATIAESAPVTIQVTAGTEEPQPVETDLTVTADAAAYSVGDTAAFTAAQTPETGLSDYHWFVKRAGDADYSVIAGATGASLAHPVSEGDDGALIVARLYDASHILVAESAPVALTVKDAVPVPVAAKPETAPAAKTAADLGENPAGGITLSASSVPAGSVVAVGVGAARAGSWNAAWLFSEPVLLAGDWVQANAAGDFVVTIPANTPVGEHRVAVYDRDGALIGWQLLTVTAASHASPVSVSASELGRTGSATGIPASIAVLLLLAGAGALFFRARSRRAA